MIAASVLIVDDHRLFADVVASALDQLGARVIGPVGTAADAIATAARERPDVVLLDLALPDSSGVEAGREILRATPETVILALTASTDRAEVATVLDVGFRGFIAKDAPLSSVVGAIRNGLEGRVAVIRPARPGTRSSRRPSTAALMANGLTAREREVLGLIVDGSSSDEIAERLGITTNTVRTHVQGILTKLQVHSRLEAAGFAVRHGLVPQASGPPKAGSGGEAGGLVRSR
jgi:two-component system, NarL family, nitrate/nitrite response regulator NarL